MYHSKKYSIIILHYLHATFQLVFKKGNMLFFNVLLHSMFLSTHVDFLCFGENESYRKQQN